MRMDIENPAVVGKRATDVASLASDAALWLERNRASLKADPGSLIRDFRRSSRRAERLAVAAARPVGVAVFGASQAGKSYLVSRLCAAGQAMQVRFGDAEYDFLRDINPPGGIESSGLVSRFTTSAPATPPGAPVAVRLLSQTDLVRIFANTFLEDFDADVALPTPQILEQVMTNAANRAGPVPRDGMVAADIEDLAEYFDRHFRGHALLAALDAAGYWRRVTDLAPRLAASDRAAIFAPLWGGVAQFTNACGELIEALAKLNFAADAFCAADALVPRETSILDAQTLFKMGDAAAAANPLTARTLSGSQAVISGPTLAALVAEVIIPISERPFAFLDNADLLDFPGARTREMITNIERFFAEPDRLGRVFLRGKVAYLFQRYNAEQEIAAMVLCVGPSNQEVQTLPRMVTDWINSTIGATPEARARQRNSLFLVLTKFDSEFEIKQGEDVASGLRWTNRLMASLIDFFGKAAEWPSHWAEGKPFNNLFWLRNPAIGFGAVFDYGPDGKELGVGPRTESFVQPRREAYLANELVRLHFEDPAAAWDAALTPNDGGIGRLAAALAPVSARALKCRQLAARTEELAHSMFDRLRMHWRSDDKAAEVSKAREQGALLARALVGVTKAQRFGALLLRLCVSPELVSGVLWRMEMEPAEAMPIGIVSDASELEDELGDILGGLNAPGAATQARDRFGQFVDLLLAAWQDQVMALTRDEPHLASLKLDAEQCVVLADGLSTAARRLALADKIADALRRNGGFHGAGAAGDQKSARLAEEMINHFVAFLGFDDMPEAARPLVGKPPRPVFMARPPVVGLPALGPTPTAYDTRYYAEWISAVVELITANAESGAGAGFDRAANSALGALLTELAPREAA